MILFLRLLTTACGNQQRHRFPCSAGKQVPIERAEQRRPGSPSFACDCSQAKPSQVIFVLSTCLALTALHTRGPHAESAAGRQVSAAQQLCATVKGAVGAAAAHQECMATSRWGQPLLGKPKQPHAPRAANGSWLDAGTPRRTCQPLAAPRQRILLRPVPGVQHRGESEAN